MSFVGRYSSHFDAGRLDGSVGAYRTSTNHFYTPSRQPGQNTYSRGSSSGPGTASQTSRFSLAQKKPESGTELRSSFSRAQTQSASKQPGYDYTQRRHADLGQLEAGRTTLTMPTTTSGGYRPQYRAHDYSQLGLTDKYQSTLTSKYATASKYSSSMARETEFRRSGTVTPGKDKDDPRFRESITSFGNAVAKEPSKPAPRQHVGGNFEESKHSHNRDFREFTKRIEQIESKIHNLEKHNTGPINTEESQSQSLTIGSGSSYKLEGDSHTLAKRENNSPKRESTKKLEQTPEAHVIEKEISKPKAVSEFGSLASYESKYSKAEPIVNSKYEGFLRQPRYGSYRSTLIENFNSKEVKDKYPVDELIKNTIQQREIKEKTLGQSFSATFGK